MTLIYFIILLSIIIIIHELGHFMFAKLFNVYCYEFSMGMGPKIWQKKGKETVYTLRLLPIGGYVSMAGENDGMQEEYTDIVVPKERTLTHLKEWKRIIIMGAGIFMNFMLAWVIMSGFYLYQGVYPVAPEPIIASVVEGSPADLAGLEANDYILKVTLEDGTVIEPEKFEDITNYTLTYDGDITYTVERNGQTLDFVVTPYQDQETKGYYSGINSLPYQAKEVTLLNAPILGASYLFDSTKTMLIALVRMFQGFGLEQLSGPVGIYTATETYANLGIEYFLMLIALLSLNLGIVNALPLPVLDGGRIIITLGEWIFKRKLNQKIEIALMSACWVLLIGLMIFVTWNDIMRLM